MSEVQADLTNLSPEKKRELLAQLLQKKLSATQAVLPLSYGQQSMWFMYQLAPDSPAYNVSFTARICSAVDIPALTRAFQTLLDRHACLRTTFTMQEGIPVQVIPGYRELVLEQVDASALTEPELRQEITRAYERPFDLEHGPIFRVYLFTRSATDHVLLIVAHHIAFDGWSAWILLDEFRTAYIAEQAGARASLPPLSRQYIDFVKWQTEMLVGSEGKQHEAYWLQQLAGEAAPLDLATDRPRPPMQTFYGASHEFMLSAALAAQVKTLAKARQTTPYTLLLAAFQVLLHRYTGQADVWVGSPTIGRSHAEFAGIIGDFINTNVMRAKLSGNPTFTAFLNQMRQTVLDALEHQDYPFTLLVEKLMTRPDPSRSPLFQVAFDLQRLHRFDELAVLFVPGKSEDHVEVGGLVFKAYPLPQQEGMFDLTLQIVELGNTFGGAFKYNLDLFDAATIARMAGHFQMLLTSIVADPDRRVSDLPLLTEAERHQLLVEWNDTRTDYADYLCVHHLLEAQVARTPNAIAATCESERLTYRQLNERANQLAHYLKQLGVGPETLVGISVERSLDMLVGLLGILKAGGAYVPLDPAFPKERIAFMLHDAQCPVLITQQHLVAELPEHAARVVCLDADWPTIAQASTSPVESEVTAENLAYVLYTSGSTGKPKGVQILHRALANFLLSMQTEPGLSPEDILLSVTTLSFDIAGLELYLPLITGARVVIASRDVAVDGPRLLALLNQSGATLMQATPATWRMLVDSGWSDSPGLKMLCGGEALPVDLARQMLERGGALWNMYGPTETTIWSSVCLIEADAEWIPLGHPIANTQFYILDAQRQPAPIGVPGELYIGGDGVARGYLNRPELTAERFVSNPFRKDEGGGMRAEREKLPSAFIPHTALQPHSGCKCPSALLYKTGDLVRYRRDGNIEFIGRVDFQVKIRGFRIELGEIEAALSRHPGVRQAVVIVREDTPGDKRLAAYITTHQAPAPDTAEIRRYLRDSLPDYMIPSACVALETLPLTPNGKIDRKALPAPELGIRDEGYAAPTTEMEKLVAGVWQDVLQLDQVGLYDNFFDLGGHSLASVQVVSRLEQLTGSRINPALIRLQTLGQLAASYEQQQANPAPSEAPRSAGGVSRLFRAVRRAVSMGDR
ncbi:MAG TPA: amino acid adenylation domain-containing protein [Anaerolineae bacterium]|nr:amino acid adenylation domain-containing protein [Anaerolineae bacterium]